MTSTKYRKTRIRAILIQDEQYKDISSLKVLKFVEAIEDEENLASIRKTLPNERENPVEEGLTKGFYLKN